VENANAHPRPGGNLSAGHNAALPESDLRYQYIPADKGKMDAITKQKQDEVITRKMVCKRPDIAKDTLIELGEINEEVKKDDK
jgi:hypothetical protein